MNEMSRTTLRGQIARKVMFAYADHPISKGRFLEVTLYGVGDAGNQWALCMSEGIGKYNLELSRAGMGATTPGELIARFAQRFIDGAPLEELRPVLEETLPLTLPGIVFEWEQA